MNRRDALSRVALILGGTIAGSGLFLSGCKSGYQVPGLPLSAEDIAYLDEIADTIIPDTDTPGAKAAKVGAFMNVMVSDCYTENEQKAFLNGMKELNEAANKKLKCDFMDADSGQRTLLLKAIDQEARDYAKNKKAGDPPHYFALMKQLTLLGYFTSQIGCEQALRYVAVPGRFDGCVPYHKGDKAWAT
ncbi:MAG TPA: gluconate 2-dehydrogenase subunit 3 family protein [Chitinophagaceae bacterium]|nr:gluconate 2-dehydrogenase subunit 3 family protein [Chitinophagaceae bacterium]